MKRGTRWLLIGLGAATVLFGLGCLNYTKAEGLEHHREAAVRYNLPPPSGPIRHAGIVTLIAGSGLVGFTFGRGRAGRSS
jgi:hypothetical protein